MIRIIGHTGSVAPAVKLLRAQFSVTIGEARDLVVKTPSELPHIEWHGEEKRFRKALTDAGCTLEDACPECFGNRTKECGGCYDRHTHCAHNFPKSYTGMMCGSMHFLTSCGRNWFELVGIEPPRVHSNLSDDEREALIAKVNCPECRQVLANWDYLEVERV